MAAFTEPCFTCYTAQKVVVFDEDREEVLKEQRSKLEGYLKGHEEAGENVILSGGCIGASAGLLGHGCGFVAAFIGTLDNYGHLLKQHPLENKENSHSNFKQRKYAEIVCHMYKAYGRILQQRLRGDYNFVLYDSAQGRVLAVSSHQSSKPLLQARGPDGCLIITTRGINDLPDGCALPTQILPGHVKYGWSSDPQPFADPRIAAELKAAKIGRSPSKKITIQNVDDVPVVVQRSSLSFAESEAISEEGASEVGTEPQSPAIKKTRRGKRAGKNQKLRAELMARLNSDVGRNSLDLRNSMDFSRASFESRNSLDFPPSPSVLSSSVSGRANNQTWWRTDTPRSSFEVRSLPNAGIHRSSFPTFSRSSMSATASPFVPSSHTQPIQIVRSQSNAANSRGPSKLQPRTASQEMNVSRVVLKTSMSGTLGGHISPFSDSTEVPVQGQSGKADAAWNEGDDSSQTTPFQYPIPATPSPSQSKTSPTRKLSNKKSQSSSSEGSGNDSSQEAAKLSRLIGHDVMAEIGGIKKRDDSAQNERRPMMTAVREDSAHEDLSSDSNKEGSTSRTAPIEIKTGRRQERISRKSSRAPSESEPSDWENIGGQSPRGNSPPRPPKHPGGTKFARMLKSMINRRPSHVDLESELKKEEKNSQTWARSSSHNALVDLEGPTGLWDAQRTHNRGSSGSLASNKSSEKSKTKSGKSSPHGSHHNLAWLARQASSLFSKSKSCTDLKEMETQPQPITAKVE